MSNRNPQGYGIAYIDTLVNGPAHLMAVSTL